MLKTTLILGIALTSLAPAYAQQNRDLNFQIDRTPRSNLQRSLESPPPARPEPSTLERLERGQISAPPSSTTGSVNVGRDYYVGSGSGSAIRERDGTAPTGAHVGRRY